MSSDDDGYASFIFIGFCCCLKKKKTFSASVLDKKKRSFECNTLPINKHRDLTALGWWHCVTRFTKGKVPGA